MSFEKIIFVGDFLVNRNLFQTERHQGYMERLLRFPIESATGICTESQTYTIADNAEVFSLKHLSKLLDRNLYNDECDSVHRYNADLNENDFKKPVLEYLGQHFSSKNLYIGCELSVLTREVLEQIGLTYIDLWWHPIRFLDDLFLAFTSNHQGIFDAIQPFELKENVFYLYAGQASANIFYNHQNFLNGVRPNSALFIGQCTADKSLIEGGKMLTLLDFRKKFEAETKRFETVYYSRHPYVHGDDPILDYIKKQKNVILTKDPAYYYFCSDKIEKVFGISSSAITEAKYFGKQIEFYGNPVLSLNSTFDLNNFISVWTEQFMSPHFWAKILSPALQTKDVAPLTFFNSKNKMRDVLQNYHNFCTLDPSTQSSINALK